MIEQSKIENLAALKEQKQFQLDTIHALELAEINPVVSQFVNDSVNELLANLASQENVAITPRKRITGYSAPLYNLVYQWDGASTVVIEFRLPVKKHLASVIVSPIVLNLNS